MRPKRKVHSDERALSIRSLQRRDFTYTVFVTKRAGKIRCITAGCRYWQSFEKAFAHYRGEYPLRKEWTDASLIELVSTKGYVDGWRRIAAREEARAILRELERWVRRYQHRQWRRRHSV